MWRPLHFNLQEEFGKSDWLLDLVIENVGRGPAIDLRCSTRPSSGDPAAFQTHGLLLAEARADFGLRIPQGADSVEVLFDYVDLAERDHATVFTLDVPPLTSTH